MVNRNLAVALGARLLFHVWKVSCQNQLWQGFPSGSVVKNLPANAGDVRVAVRSLGQEDPLEEDMATHSSIFAWKILWTEEPGGIQSSESHSVMSDSL